MMNTQEIKVVEWMKHVLLELRTYAHSQPIDEETGRNVDALVAAGALSSESAAFIRDEDVRFYGFNSDQLGNAIPVLDKELTTCRLTGTSAGYVLVKRI
jgi:hypothetical protein